MKQILLLGLVGIVMVGLFQLGAMTTEITLNDELTIAKAEITAQAGALVFHSEQRRDDFINSHRAFVFKVVNQGGTSGGTGFLVKAPSGRVFLMTNAHVCEVAKNNHVYVTNDSITFYAKVAATYASHDLCLIDVPVQYGLEVAPAVRNTQNIFIIGHPLLEPLATTKGQISGELMINVVVGPDEGNCKGEGYFPVKKSTRINAQILPFDKDRSALDGLFGFGLCVRRLTANPVTAKIHPGNSGSPVLNAIGQVVGVAFAGGERDYIIPLRYVQQFLVGR